MTRQYSRISMTQHIRTRKIFKWKLVRKRVFIFLQNSIYLENRLTNYVEFRMIGLLHDTKEHFL